MSRQLLWTMLVFVVALGSGVVVGMNLPRHHESPRQEERSWLADELKLTTEQREKMKSIWSEMLPGGQGRGDRHGDSRRQVYKDRDDAIAALIPAEKKADYDKVLARVDQQMAEIGKERERAMQKAVEQTKAILSSEQRTKYEELLKKGPFGPHRPGTNPSTTRPAAQ